MEEERTRGEGKIKSKEKKEPKRKRRNEDDDDDDDDINDVDDELGRRDEQIIENSREREGTRANLWDLIVRQARQPRDHLGAPGLSHSSQDPSPKNANANARIDYRKGSMMRR